MSTRRSNAQRTKTTRRQLTQAARRLFGEQGYSSTSLSEIAKNSGMTTGALYHHWSGKEALLADVVHDIYGDLAGRIRLVVAPDASPFDQLVQGGREFLRVCSDPKIARILLLDAPAVLGYAKWREIDDRWWLCATIHLIEKANPQMSDPQTSRGAALVLLGALTYLGQEVAADSSSTAVASAASMYERLLRALFAW